MREVNEQELRQMFRDNTPFVVRVTPKLSKRIQEIGFSEGIYWNGDEKQRILNTDKLFLYFSCGTSDKKFTWADGTINCYKERQISVNLSTKSTQKTKLAETDLPCTNDFEAFFALVNGYVIRSNTDGDILRFKDGYLCWDKEGKVYRRINWSNTTHTICKEERGKDTCVPMTASLKDCEGQWREERRYGGDMIYFLYVEGGHRLSVLDRLTGFGYRDIETGYRNETGDFWLVRGGFDIREHGSLTVEEAVAKVKRLAQLG